MPPKEREDELGDRDRFEHMLEAARDAVRFISGQKREDLATDRMLCRALINCIQVIGEAASRTSDAGRARAPSLPWGKMVGMRHILVHAYDIVDEDTLWGVAEQDLPALIVELETALKAWA